MDVSEYIPWVSVKKIYICRDCRVCAAGQSISHPFLVSWILEVFPPSGCQWLTIIQRRGGFFNLQIQAIWDLTSGEYCEKLRILTLDFFSSVNGSNWLSSKWIDYVTKIVLVPKCCKGYLSDTIIFVNKIQQNIFRDIEAMKCPYA